MLNDKLPRLEECTCLAVRQAARHVTQFYDQHLGRSACAPPSSPFSPG